MLLLGVLTIEDEDETERVVSLVFMNVVEVSTAAARCAEDTRDVGLMLNLGRLYFDDEE